MIVSREEMPALPLEIDLSGPSGNVFSLMAIAKGLAKEIYNNEHPFEVADQIVSELADDNSFHTNLGDYITEKMQESDYENALNVFEKYFGDYVILYR